MRYIALTFDDARADTYTNALPVLREAGLPATLFATTGYIDGSWPPPPDWAHAGPAMTVQQLLALRDAGWEIGLHGDCHRTDLEDWKTALNKLSAWGISTAPIGCSLPRSREKEAALCEIREKLGTERIAYIRGGRACDTRSLKNRVLFALYTYAGSTAAFLRFNRENLCPLPLRDRWLLPSVVVRNGDRPQHLLRLVRQMPDNTLCILMLHSILEETHPDYGRDAWSWSIEALRRLCAGLRQEQENGALRVVCLRDAVGCCRE